MNVKLIQELLKDDLKKYRSVNSFLNASYTEIGDSVFTCSMAEITTLYDKDVAISICKALSYGYRSLMASLVDKTAIARYKKFGFVPSFRYQGNHGRLVTVMFLNLNGYTI
jgi:hypothetical protein